VYSQNGEDGILEKIFDAIGTTNKFHVEFGVETAIECNTRYLREQYGFSGLLMDGGNENLDINLRKEFITAENILNLFAKYDVPTEPDLVSIDIDFNDWHIWRTIGTQYRPRVVVMEHNAGLGQWADKVVLYDSKGKWDGSNYFGASATAMAKLGRYLGYTFVYAEIKGVNMFFVRDDVLKETGVVFKGMGSVEDLYSAPNFGSHSLGGWGPDGQHRLFITADELLLYQDWENKPEKWKRLRCRPLSEWALFENCPHDPYEWVSNREMLPNNAVMMQHDGDYYLVGRARHVDNGELVFGYVPISSLYMRYNWGGHERKASVFKVLVLADGFKAVWQPNQGGTPSNAVGEHGYFSLRGGVDSHMYVGALSATDIPFVGKIVREFDKLYCSWNGALIETHQYSYLTTVRS
jgi:hypothetical protein